MKVNKASHRPKLKADAKQVPKRKAAEKRRFPFSALVGKMNLRPGWQNITPYRFTLSSPRIEFVQLSWKRPFGEKWTTDGKKPSAQIDLNDYGAGLGYTLILLLTMPELGDAAGAIRSGLRSKGIRLQKVKKSSGEWNFRINNNITNEKDSNAGFDIIQHWMDTVDQVVKSFD